MQIRETVCNPLRLCFRFPKVGTQVYFISTISAPSGYGKATMAWPQTGNPNPPIRSDISTTLLYFHAQSDSLSAEHHKTAPNMI